MHSSQYHYLGIYHDADLSVHCNTYDIVHFLRTFPEVVQTESHIFSNRSNFPLFFTMTLLYAHKLDKWSEKNINPVRTNLIDIVCSKDNTAAFEQFKQILIKVAEFLKWKLVDEMDDDGNENITLWAPFYS
jgi:hypothetical protein